jgi:hypothetical protein
MDYFYSLISSAYLVGFLSAYPVRVTENQCGGHARLLYACG